MTEKLDDVWAGRDFPVLIEVVRRIDGGAPMPSVVEISQALGVDVEQVKLAGAALSRRGLVEVRETSAVGCGTSLACQAKRTS